MCLFIHPLMDIKASAAAFTLLWVVLLWTVMSTHLFLPKLIFFTICGKIDWRRNEGQSEFSCPHSAVHQLPFSPCLRCVYRLWVTVPPYSGSHSSPLLPAPVLLFIPALFSIGFPWPLKEIPRLHFCFLISLSSFHHLYLKSLPPLLAFQTPLCLVIAFMQSPQSVITWGRWKPSRKIGKGVCWCLGKSVGSLFPVHSFTHFKN